MAIEFVTAADERARCCVNRQGGRCSQPTAVRFTAVGCDEHEQELYVYSCSDCAGEIADFLGADYVATLLGRDCAPAPSELAGELGADIGRRREARHTVAATRPLPRATQEHHGPMGWMHVDRKVTIERDGSVRSIEDDALGLTAEQLFAVVILWDSKRMWAGWLSFSQADLDHPAFRRWIEALPGWEPSKLTIATTRSGLHLVWRRGPTTEIELTPKIPRGSIIGERIGGSPTDEREHYMRCPDCGGWLDMRDLGDVFAHVGPHECPTQQ